MHYLFPGDSSNGLGPVRTGLLSLVKIERLRDARVDFWSELILEETCAGPACLRSGFSFSIVLL